MMKVQRELIILKKMLSEQATKIKKDNKVS
jgi:hypothetical protein